jgi:hypothetical protein
MEGESMKRYFFPQSATFTFACLLTLFAAFTVSVLPAAAEIKECVGPKGDVVFTDSQCAPGYSLKGSMEGRAAAPSAQDGPHDMTGRDEEAFVKVLLLTADKLEDCEPYAIKFSHPFTGEDMVRKIAGLVDGKCLYVEEMPGGGRMECRFSSESRKAVAQYLMDVGNAETVSSSSTFSSDGAETTDIIDGREVSNPMQESMNNGECQALGY